MKIEIDLFCDAENILLGEIDLLQANGFVFDSFPQWKAIRIKDLKWRLANLVSGSHPYRETKKNFSKKRLKKAYQDHLIYSYLNLRHRCVDERPRSIFYSKDFKCPEAHREDLRRLEGNIRNGGSLFPYLSRKIFKSSYKDGMLNDWGIQHLHLSSEPDPKHPGLNKGGSDVLYVVFEDNNAYFLCITKHGKWADISLLETIKESFPHIIEPFKVNGVSLEENMSLEEYERGRRARLNMFVNIGGDVYMGPGMGTVASGDSLKVVDSHDKAFFFYKEAGKEIQRRLSKNIGSLPQEKQALLKDIRLKMDCLTQGYIVVRDSENQIYVRLDFNEEYTMYTGSIISIA